MDLLLDEVDLALLEIYEMTADHGISSSQTRVMLRERIEIAAELIDLMGDDWPDMTSTAYH